MNFIPYLLRKHKMHPFCTSQKLLGWRTVHSNAMPVSSRWSTCGMLGWTFLDLRPKEPEIAIPRYPGWTVRAKNTHYTVTLLSHYTPTHLATIRAHISCKVSTCWDRWEVRQTPLDRGYCLLASGWTLLSLVNIPSMDPICCIHRLSMTQNKIGTYWNQGSCIHSYQLLEALPELGLRIESGFCGWTMMNPLGVPANWALQPSVLRAAERCGDSWLFQ